MPQPPALAACGQSHPAFGGRCIPAEPPPHREKPSGSGPPAHPAVMEQVEARFRLALSAPEALSNGARTSGRYGAGSGPKWGSSLIVFRCGRVRCGPIRPTATEALWFFVSCGQIWPNLLRSNWHCVPLIVAFRSKYTRDSSLTRLDSRTPTGRTGPRPPRRSRDFIPKLLAGAGRPRVVFLGASAAASPALGLGGLSFGAFLLAAFARCFLLAFPDGVHGSGQ